MKNKKHLEEKDLDGLLNSLFLETNASAAGRTTTHFIFEQEYGVIPDTAKEQELLRKLNQKPRDPGNYLNFLIAILVVAVAGAGMLIYQKSEKKEVVQQVKISEPVSEEKRIQEIADPKSEHTLSPTTESREGLPKQIESGNKQTETSTGSRLRSDDIAVYYPQSVVGSKSKPTFFNPTEQEMVFYTKAKHKMLEEMQVFEKETYQVAEEGEMQYRGNRLTIHPFVWSNHTVTNLEYKAFLTDLIKSGRSEDFKSAVVKNENWINYNDNILATTYFFDPKYNDFPVVNISTKAAALFCEWMEKEINQYAQQLNPSMEPMYIRLPYDSEWLFATEKGYLPMSNCNGYNTIYDPREDIIDIDYLKRVARVKKQNQSKSRFPDELYSVNRYSMNEDQVLQLFEKAFTYTDSVYFNREQLFGKVAHVSEMVIQQQTGQPIVVGSCWKSKQEYSHMLKEFKAASASPFVGFRLVLSKRKVGKDVF